MRVLLIVALTLQACGDAGDARHLIKGPVAALHRERSLVTFASDSAGHDGLCREFEDVFERKGAWPEVHFIGKRTTIDDAAEDEWASRDWVTCEELSGRRGFELIASCTVAESRGFGETLSTHLERTFWFDGWQNSVRDLARVCGERGGVFRRASE